MSIDIHWDNEERTIMMVEYSENWTWDDLHEALSLSNRMADEISHHFDVIHDLRSTVHLPPNAFPNIRNLMSNIHPRNRANVYVGMSPFVRAIWNSFNTVYSVMARSKKFYFAETPNHARIVLEDAFEKQR